MNSTTSRNRLQTLMLACCSLMLCQEASAQSASRAGEYSFDDGQYRQLHNVVVNNTLASAAGITQTATDAQNFLNSYSHFGAWRANETAGGLAAGGLGFQLNSVLNQREGPHLLPPNQFINYRFGPLFIDEVYAGAGILYSDYQGHPVYGFSPNQSRASSDDNWASILSLTLRATMKISDRFALSLNPSVYYLPMENEVGWMIASPQLTNGAFIAPRAALQSALKFDLGENFDLAFADEFYVIHHQASLLRNSPYYWANLGDTTPMDYAGRYPIGSVGGIYEADARGDSSFAANDRLFGKEQVVLNNNARAMLLGRLAERTFAEFYVSRSDWWNYDFANNTSWNILGAHIAQQGTVYSPYARYEMAVYDDHEIPFFDTNYQFALVGVNARWHPDFVGYAEGGWLWSDIRGEPSTDSWIGHIGLRHRLGPHTWHGVDAGRSPLGVYRSRFLATYAQYYLSHQIGPAAQATMFVSRGRWDTLGGTNAVERDFTSAGVFVDVTISDRSQLSLLYNFEDMDAHGAGRAWKMHTYRVQYMRQFNLALSGSVFYQYQTAGSGRTELDQFQEHLLYMGVTRRF